MPAPIVYRDRVYESGTKWHRARLVDRNRNILLQADFTGSGTVQVYDLAASNADAAIYSNSSLTIASIIFNSLQEWEVDDEGYNFESAVTSNNVTWEGGHTYRTCYTLKRAVSSSEGNLKIIFENLVEPELAT